MNSYDFVITIALGSTFAAGLLQKSVSIVDVIFAFGLLVGLQNVTTALAVRYPLIDRLVKSEPTLLFSEGRFWRQSMKEAHVTEGEVRSGMRAQGYSHLNQVAYVILETNGKIIAVGKSSKVDSQQDAQYA